MVTDSRPDEVQRRLVHVKYAVAAVGEAEHSLRDAVTRARSVGATWSEVADALGVPTETVRRRYGDVGGDVGGDLESEADLAVERPRQSR